MTGSYVRQSRERPKGEHENLGAVGHRRKAVTARDLLALDGAVYCPRLRHNKAAVGAGCRRRRRRRVLRRAVVGRLGIIDTAIAGIRMRDGAGGTLHPERLCACRDGREGDDENRDTNLKRLPHGGAASFPNWAHKQLGFDPGCGGCVLADADFFFFAKLQLQFAFVKKVVGAGLVSNTSATSDVCLLFCKLQSSYLFGSEGQLSLKGYSKNSWGPLEVRIKPFGGVVQHERCRSAC